MKARVKATGEIVEVEPTFVNGNNVYSWVTDNGYFYSSGSLDFESLTEESTDVKEKSFPKHEPDYYTKLHHQAAIAAMQGILSNDELLNDIFKGVYPTERPKYLANRIDEYTSALVNKLKNEK